MRFRIKSFRKGKESCNPNKPGIELRSRCGVYENQFIKRRKLLRVRSALADETNGGNWPGTPTSSRKL